MVSVVITTHNRLERLKRAVESVLSQTYENIELIVVDDASTDGTREWCGTQSDFRYIWIKKEESNGACRARNKGLASANGVYIAFLDDDDEWVPEKIEKQINAMNEDIDIVSARWLVQTKRGRWLLAMTGIEDWSMERLLMRCWCGATSVPLLRASAVREVGGFDEDVVKGQDHDLWIRMIRAGSHAAVVETPLVRYYYSEDSTFTTTDRLKLSTDRKVKVYAELYEKYHASKSYVLNDTACSLLLQKDLAGYFKYKIKALTWSPLSKYNLLELGYLRNKLRGRDDLLVPYERDAG